KQVLHEGAGLTWIRTTQSFLSGAILYVKDKYKEKARLSDVRGVPPAFRKKTTLRIFSIKRAVILRIKRLFYT
ncbi:hypothetical protein P9Z44_09920, partial [Bacillus cereus]|nr:hypothetical protein [Bacillus cereus]